MAADCDRDAIRYWSADGESSSMGDVARASGWIFVDVASQIKLATAAIRNLPMVQVETKAFFPQMSQMYADE